MIQKYGLQGRYILTPRAIILFGRELRRIGLFRSRCRAATVNPFGFQTANTAIRLVMYLWAARLSVAITRV